MLHILSFQPYKKSCNQQRVTSINANILLIIPDTSGSSQLSIFTAHDFKTIIPESILSYPDLGK